ncbi:MAG: hypothetical protein KGN16_18665, partial [Burkholderiales bacterium]|nr:hypothetical protein [Burkholderiales bacterium]
MKPPRVLDQGFLGHLARRLDAAEPVLQRRQPSRYEPVRPWSGDRLVQVDAAPEMTVAATRPVPSAAASAVHERPMPD